MDIVTPRGVQVHPPSSRINYKRRAAPLILKQHSQALRYSCYYCLGDLSLLPQLLSAIPVASAASTVLARTGLRNLCNAEILLGIARQSDF